MNALCVICGRVAVMVVSFRRQLTISELLGVPDGASDNLCAACNRWRHESLCIPLAWMPWAYQTAELAS